MRDTEREREAETQAEGEAGSMHWEPDVAILNTTEMHAYIWLWW